MNTVTIDINGIIYQHLAVGLVALSICIIGSILFIKGINGSGDAANLPIGIIGIILVVVPALVGMPYAADITVLDNRADLIIEKTLSEHYPQIKYDKLTINSSSETIAVFTSIDPNHMVRHCYFDNVHDDQYRLVCDNKVITPTP